MTANQIKFAQHREQARSNRAQEEIKRGELAEKTRAAQASEEVNWFTARNVDKYNTILGSVAQDKAAEEVRANRAREYETARSNKAKEQETNRANLAREEDTDYSNTVSAINTGISFGNSVIRGVSEISKTAGGILSLFG